MTYPKNKGKRITIKDVAQAAGVSTQTVSRVMNKSSYVSVQTRQQVESVVKQLGYNPSTLARSLIQKRSYTLGIVTSGLKYIGPSRTLNGIADKADELGYMLLMRELDIFNLNRIDDVIDSFLARQVDGIICVIPEIGNNHAWVEERMEKIPVPMIFIATQPRDGVPSVSVDNFQGGALATQHLLDCGRKNIGHISGPLSWWEADERKRGWLETLSSNGYVVSERHCAEGNWSSESGRRAFIQLFDSYPEMDAVFVANDQMALSVLREASVRGINIPDQLAVIGFDDIPESAYFYPSLTTISQDLQLLGDQAVQDVVKMIQAQQANQLVNAQSRFIHTALVVRESSKCV